MKLAEALLLRKHLAMKVEQLKVIKLQGDNGLFEWQSVRFLIERLANLH